jgi:hypothetical protein
MGDGREKLRAGRPEDLASDVEHALRFHARGYFRFKPHDDFAPSSIARRIVEHLKLANWRFFRGPGMPAHGTSHGPQRSHAQEEGEDDGDNRG